MPPPARRGQSSGVPLSCLCGLRQDVGTPPFNVNLASQEQVDGLRQQAMLLLQNAGAQILNCIILKHRYGRLSNDRASIKLFRHQMHRAAGDLDTIRQRIGLGTRRHTTGKGGQERGVNIENAMRKSAHNRSIQDTIKTRQNHQRDLRLQQRRQDGSLLRFAGWIVAADNQARWKVMRRRALQRWSAGMIAEYQSNLRAQSSTLNSINERLQVAAAP